MCLSELRSCVKVEVAVLGSPSLIIRTVSVDVKQHWTRSQNFRAQELCKSRGGCPGLPVPNNPYGLCGRQATTKKRKRKKRRQLLLLLPRWQKLLLISSRHDNLENRQRCWEQWRKLIIQTTSKIRVELYHKCAFYKCIIHIAVLTVDKTAHLFRWKLCWDQTKWLWNRRETDKLLNWHTTCFIVGGSDVGNCPCPWT